MLNIVDDFTREMVGQLVSASIDGAMVARLLNQIMEHRGKPDSFVCNNGTEYTSKAMSFWSKESAVQLNFM